ncbi:MAG TPA: DUF503 domain-containing protein [Bdellovibrionota bacterium]|nr:DUF503 domain-containing protein [Bdellovibrionota bacterium]
MIVGILRLKLFLANSHSLKDKRQVLLKIKDKVQHHFNASIAEVGDNDTWQSAVLGVSVVGNEAGLVQSMLDKIERMIEELYVAQIVSRDRDVYYAKDHFTP